MINFLQKFLSSELVDQLRFENNQLRQERDKYLELLLEKGGIIGNEGGLETSEILKGRIPIQRNNRIIQRRELEDRYNKLAVDAARKEGENAGKQGA